MEVRSFKTDSLIKEEKAPSSVMPGKSQFYNATTQRRMLEMLQSDLGAEIWNALGDPSTTEVSVNSDGTVWVDIVAKGRTMLEVIMIPDKVFSVLAIVADAKGEKIGEKNPSFDAIIPGYGFRFVGVLPPMSPAPAFTIRKKPGRIITLDEYEQKQIITPFQKAVIIKACQDRENIFIAGGTGSGKTTMANACLDKMAETGHRIITIEDTPELLNPAKDKETHYTVPGVRSMQDILKTALREHPDRLVFGEVRGSEVQDMLMAWNTGHKGGLCTIHADSALDSLYRIEEMLETIPNYKPNPRSISRAIDIIIYIKTTSDSIVYPAGRYVSEIAKVSGLNEDGSYKLDIIG